MIQLQQSAMEVIHKNPHELKISNVFKEGYWNQNGASLGVEIDSESAELASTLRKIALRLEGSLRAAKKAHLQTSEVLLPPDLLTRISRDIIRMSETEPCGLGGCLILLDFESGTSTTTTTTQHSTNPTNNNNNHNNHSYNNTLVNHNNNNNNNATAASKRKIGKVKFDSHIVTTFELHLSLREDLAPWYSRLPQILRNLSKGSTIVISPAYTLTKKKLYRAH